MDTDPAQEKGAGRQMKHTDWVFLKTGAGEVLRRRDAPLRWAGLAAQRTEQARLDRSEKRWGRSREKRDKSKLFKEAGLAVTDGARGRGHNRRDHSDWTEKGART